MTSGQLPQKKLWTGVHPPTTTTTTLLNRGCERQFIILHWILFDFCSSEEIKARLQYSKAILIYILYFMSNVWSRAHFPLNFVIWWKKQHFRHEKHDSTLFHDFSVSQPPSSAKNEQNITLQLRQNSGETDLVTLINQNMPKIGCFGAFSHFSVFEINFLRLWNHNLFFYSSNVYTFISYLQMAALQAMWDEISQMTDIRLKCTKGRCPIIKMEI